MKYILSFIILFPLFFPGDIYSIPLKSIDNNPIDLNNYRGKKIMFVILPLSAGDTSVSAAELAAIETKYSGTLTVIGIPAEETGYTESMKAKVKALYKNQLSNFILTEGMKVKKISGAGQTALLQWLTDMNKNKHFDEDVRGAGHKFFVDEKGELYAVMGPHVKLSNPIISRILSKVTPQ